MANTGKEPLGSMGNDAPMPALSSRSRMLFDYFTQKFAQVTNPPLDWEREEIVTSLESAIGPEPNLLADSELHAKKILIPLPVVNSDEMAQLKRLDKARILGGYYRPYVVKGLYQVAGGGKALEERLDEIFAEIDEAIANGKNFIVLSDRESNHTWGPIPSLLLTSAVQHHLLRRHTRTQISMAVEAGDVREIHHVALLIAYGAACVNPYLAFESVEDLARNGYLKVDADTAVKNLTKALSTGVLKIMSKMGVSTIMSYRGAQLFEAVGLSQEVIDEYFTGTTSRVGGVGLEEIAEEVAIRHRVAYPNQWSASPHRNLRTGGDYKWRRTGERPPRRSRGHLPASAVHPAWRLPDVQEVFAPHQRHVEPTHDPAWPDEVQHQPQAHRHRRSRAGLRDRQALLHRCHELRLHLAGSTRDARHRHELDWRTLQLR